MTPVPLHPIEEESYRRLAGRCDLSALGPLARPVVERVLHATADFSFAESMVVPQAAVEVGVAAIASGAPIVTDVEMVLAGISTPGAACFLGAARGDRGTAPTLSARAMELAVTSHPDGAIFAIGCAPTALERLIDLVLDGRARPALVVGVPVGLVGANEAKQRLVAHEAICSITNRGERGGSAVAAAVVNALVRLAGDDGAGRGAR